MLFQTILAAFLAIPATAQTSNVTLSYGQYQGTNLQGGITQFLGVRYANIPQRFSASGPPISFSGVKQALYYGAACQGSGSSLSAGNSEDCLFADIYAPTAVLQANSAKKLPVFVFVQGGGLTNSLGRFNGTGLVTASNLNIITVTFTYRTGAFGFLASKEVQANATLNPGLLDQVQLLRWVKKEITHFGGNSSHVTLGGQSAGGGSVLNHVAANSAINGGLFQAAIMQSPSSPPVRYVSDQQFQYDNLVKATNCTGENSLSCLRSLTSTQILAGSPIVPYPGTTGLPIFGWHIVVDGTYVQEFPFDSFANGRIAKVPIIVGAVTNEASVFTPRSISNSSQATDFIQDNFPNIVQSQLDNYVPLYDLSTTSSTNYWLKASAAYGETRYVCPSIYVSNHVSTWNFRYNIATASQIASMVDVSHGSDLAALWAPGYGSSDQTALLQGPGNQTLQWYQGYWTSFIQTFNPNTKRYPGSPTWPVYTGTQRFVFNVTGSGIESVPQDQRTRCNYLSSIGSDLQQ